MPKKCPNCRSPNVRRSTRGKDGSAQPLFRSPYRCRDCGEKFWVVSQRVCRRVGAAVAVNVMFFAVIAGLVVMFIE
jgi:transposase-like protein